MKVVVRFTSSQEKRALPILLRRSPGMILRDRTYVLDESTVSELTKAGVEFAELSRESELAHGAGSGERI
jgi:hypothetical protein